MNEGNVWEVWDGITTNFDAVKVVDPLFMGVHLYESYYAVRSMSVSTGCTLNLSNAVRWRRKHVLCKLSGRIELYT